MLPTVTTKKQLLLEIKRFLDDKNRGISVVLFAELCGIDATHLMDVFVHRIHPLTEWVQIRVDKGYRCWQRGEVAIMKKQNREKYIEYRRKPIPRMALTTGLHVVNGEIKIKLGTKNLGDYSGMNLDEQLKRG